MDTTPSHRPAARASVEEVAGRIRTSVVHEVLRIVADTWNPHVLLMLWLGFERFEMLVDSLQVSRSMLTQRLAFLQEEACVVRDARPGAHATYRLSAKGADLVCIVLLNRQWNERWGLANRVLPGLRLLHACGAPLDARMTCARCNADVGARDVKVLQTGTEPAADAAPPLPAYRRARQHRPGAAGGPRVQLQGEDLAGDRWIALILAVAFMGLRRNSQFEQALGIAPNVLADRLALLTDNAIFRRVPYQDSPKRFEYLLTEKGLDRHAIVLAMMQWADKWVPHTAPPGWNTLHLACHEWLVPRLACAACHREVDSTTVYPAQ